MNSQSKRTIRHVGNTYRFLLHCLLAGAMTLGAGLALQASEAKDNSESGAMSIQFNHTIVHARDKQQSAKFLTDILGLPEAVPFSHFLVVKLANNVSLDFRDTTPPIKPQHYAFLVSESAFDEILARVKQRGLTYWADPRRERLGEINRNYGGRGFYFVDPSDHFLEIMTRPYGSGN